VNLKDYLRIARARWKLIVGSVVALVGAAALLTALTPPTYSSEARLFVSSSQGGTGAYEDSLLSAKRVDTYAGLVNSRQIADRVITRLDLDMQAGDIANQVTATVVPDTVIIEVGGTAEDPLEAQALTQVVAEEMSAYVTELETPLGSSRAPLKVTVVDDAPFPATPDSPDPLRNLGLAAIVGLLLGLGLAIVRESLDSSVKSPEDVAAVANLPVMGNIAYDPKADKRPLLTAMEGRAPQVEAFRVLRTNMQFVDVDHDSKVFTITSSVSGEGKSTVAANLAITLAQAGQRVLLMEGDLRRPRLHEFFGLEPSVGLTTVLLGKVRLEQAVQPTAVPGLAVLNSGALPPNPSELLQSESMSDLLLDARTGGYDAIIVDAPPLLPVTDAALLAAQSDGALLVVRHGRTSRDQLRIAMERLQAVGGRPVGVVLNMVTSSSGAEAYSFGYYSKDRDRRRPGPVTSPAQSPAEPPAATSHSPTIPAQSSSEPPPASTASALGEPALFVRPPRGRDKGDSDRGRRGGPSR
jgi:capsular exopolysaccharide synthesis family protein